MTEPIGMAREAFARAPRRLSALLDGSALEPPLTPRETKLLFYALLHREPVLFAGLASVASLLGGSPKTASRALVRLTDLQLLGHDLKQGQRSPFRVWSGPAALPTSDKSTVPDVRSDFGHNFGHGSDSDRPKDEQSAGTTTQTTSDISRAHTRAKSLSLKEDHNLGEENKGRESSNSTLSVSDEELLDRIGDEVFSG